MEVRETFEAVLQRRLDRRRLLKESGAVAAVAALAPLAGTALPAKAAPGGPLNFTAIAPTTGDRIVVAPGHRSTVLLRWGEPITADAPPFDILGQSAEAQAKQFGYNCDYVGFLPLPYGSGSTDHGLLWVNHEYTNPELMFPGYTAENPERAQVDIELAAHGATIVEIKRETDGRWAIVRSSPYNRRITATTPMDITGPVRGSDWLKTGANPQGTQVEGMLNNCGGGLTPWGTVLTAEENFNQYFANLAGLPDMDPRKGLHRRLGLPNGASERKWERFYNRFDVAQEPNEPNRFGWIVEVDPYNPTYAPQKRTALGRFKHEAATVSLTPSGRAVVYSGDDERFECVYKFISARSYNPADRAGNMTLLDDGTLCVARFNDDGTGQWFPLVFGQGPLTPENQLYTQADVLVNPRYAAELVGATKMDRPEDIETNPANKKVYLAMTNNNQRLSEGLRGTNAANPRPDNRAGHIIELTEAGNDPAAMTFNWNIFLLLGDPKDSSTLFAGYAKDRVSMAATPDNILFDVDGNLWICTDGQPSALRVNDAIHAVPVEGPQRGYLRQFFGGVRGCEVASACFNADSSALFVAIQHPGEESNIGRPVSTWPDGSIPPRPSVVVVQAEGGGRIGVV